MRHSLVLASLLVLPAACGDDSGGDTAAAASTSTSMGSTADSPSPATDSGDPPSPATTDDPTTPGDTGDSDTTAPPADGTTTAGDEPLPPTNGAELVPWLEAGEYLGWTAESAIHDSDGPHFGNVRTYVNTALLQSLEAAAGEHPIDAAAVKELYGDSGTVLGWSVMVKVHRKSAGGNGWYWYEDFEGTVYADGVGKGLCTGCHSDGQDFFRSPVPLQ